MKKKAERTRELLKEAAEELFSRLGFVQTSVAAICRESGLSNGSFYRHFKTKEDIFSEVTGDMMALVTAALSEIRGENLKDALNNFYRTTFNVLWQCRKKYVAFHEAEYIFPEIDSEVDRSYTEAASGIFEPLNIKLSPVLKWFVTGSARFAAMYWIILKGMPVPNRTINSFIDFVTVGFGSKESYSKDSVNYSPEKIQRHDSGTRDSIFRAAEKLFGKKGYFNTSIYEITALAGCGQGTFYIYFDSKCSLMKELVLWGNKRLRHAMKNSSKNMKGKVNREIRNYKTFIHFMSTHKNLYEIVRESEFILDGVGQEYYEKIVHSYISSLDKSINNGEIRKLDPLDVGIFLMGLGHYMGLDLIFRPKYDIKNLDEYLHELALLLTRGLEGIL